VSSPGLSKQFRPLSFKHSFKTLLSCGKKFQIKIALSSLIFLITVFRLAEAEKACWNLDKKRKIFDLENRNDPNIIDDMSSPFLLAICFKPTYCTYYLGYGDCF
jgi:hypothetical protein